jgi:hypothetical protein
MRALDIVEAVAILTNGRVPETNMYKDRSNWRIGLIAQLAALFELWRSQREISFSRSIASGVGYAGS